MHSTTRPTGKEHTELVDASSLAAPPDIESGTRLSRRAAPRRSTLCLLSLAYALPVALLAALVRLLAADAPPRPAAAAAARDGASASPPAPPAPEAAWGDDPLAGLLLLNNASSRFFSAWWNQTQACLVLQLPSTALRAPFVVSALASRGSADGLLLHEPLTDTDYNVFHWELAPNGVDIDLVAPQLTLRPRRNGTIDESTLARAAWAGWLQTFKAKRVFTWQRASATARCAALSDAPERLTREAGDAPPQLADAANESCAEAYVRGEESYLIDVSDWMRSGVVHRLGEDSHAARLSSVRAFRSNIEVQLQLRRSEPPSAALFSEQPPSEHSAQLQLSLAELPPLDGAPHFTPRAADDRIGYWEVVYSQPGSAAAAGAPLSPRRDEREVRLLHRWRLHKAAPSAAASPPLRPITYHIDPSVPQRWRAAVRAGVENWNAAFEAAGFVGAVRALLPTDDEWPADYSAGDVRYSSITWAPSVSSTYAIGPHTVDPRTGEILDADIMFAHSWVHSWVEEHSLFTPAAHAMDGAAGRGEARLARRLAAARGGWWRSCSAAAPPAAPPRGRAATRASARTTTRCCSRCWRRRTAWPAAASYAQLSNRSFTRTRALASSVMDYIGAFVPSNRSMQGQYYSSSVGEYDKWAIQYGYTPVEGEVAGEQPAELAALAARGAASAALAFATDEDEPSADGTDPLVNLYDLGDDPLFFYEDRLALAQSLLAGVVNRTVLPAEPWTRLLPAVRVYLTVALRAGTYAAKYLGGYTVSKAHRGDPHAAAPVAAAAGAEQARALQLGLQIVAQPFWREVGALLRLAPRREGECDGLQQYCLGSAAADLRGAVLRVRKLVLVALVQEARTRGLQQQEWEAGGAPRGERGGAPPAESGGHAWLAAPHAEAAVGEEFVPPSLGGLLAAIHKVLGVPSLAELGRLRLFNPGVSDAVLLKDSMHHEMQRYWVGLLIDMSLEGVSELAALATQLLVDLQQEMATWDGRIADGLFRGQAHSTRLFQAHVSTLLRTLTAWQKGHEV
ncbi:hypothetical protein AB1Y20_011499 [Prymnesium parvum]|uniref:EcxA zinc-binding domain-containing protein n=1 Tax=Prymnesium parvum TaxID=97485 RepID=A0AB34IJC1_PRYPA